jgi:hypothetical protein
MLCAAYFDLVCYYTLVCYCALVHWYRVVPEVRPLPRTLAFSVMDALFLALFSGLAYADLAHFCCLIAHVVLLILMELCIWLACAG